MAAWQRLQKSVKGNFSLYLKDKVSCPPLLSCTIYVTGFSYHWFFTAMNFATLNPRSTNLFLMILHCVTLCTYIPFTVLSWHLDLYCTIYIFEGRVMHKLGLQVYLFRRNTDVCFMLAVRWNQSVRIRYM